MDVRTILLGLAFCLLWSSAFSVGKLAVQVAPPLWFLAIRFGIAFLFMAAVLFALGKRFPETRRDWSTGIWLGLLNNAAYLGCSFIAFKTTSSSMVALIASLMPLVTAILAWPLLQERLTLLKLIGLVFGTIGAWYILVHRLDGGLSVDDPFGFFISFVGMICLAVGTVLYRARGAHADPLSMNAIQALAASLALFPVAFLLEDPGDIILGWTLVWTMAYTAILLTIGALLLWFAMIRRVGAARASAFHFLNPGLSFVIAWLVLSEPLQLSDLVGLLPVAVGILLVNWPTARDGHSPS